MKPLYFLSITALFFAACKGPEAEDVKPKPFSNLVTLTNDQLKNISLDTANVTKEEENLTLTGKVSFDESKVEKIYPLVGGNVIKVAVSLGDYVRKGQLLAIIRSTEISDLQSQYSIAQGNMLVAKKNLDIAEDLYKSNVNSETQLINARNDYAINENEVNRLKEALSVYGASVSATDALYNVVSPIDGYVVEKNINEEMEIRPDNGTNIFTVSALNTLWVLADVYESDLAKVREGESVDIKTIAYPDIDFTGTIRHMDNVLDPESKVAHARIELDNSKGLLRPEMFAEVKVHVDLPTTKVSVATEAVVFMSGSNFVMVKKSENTFEKRPVSIGNVNSKGRMYILDGLKPGEIVVSKGSLYTASVE